VWYKAQVGYVPEEPYLYSYLTGPEYLQLVGRLRGIREHTLDDKIECFLTLLGIYDDRYQTLSSYSKGMGPPGCSGSPALTGPALTGGQPARRSRRSSRRRRCCWRRSSRCR
jgi:ABC-2 type transport system ATP-binding protein